MQHMWPEVYNQLIEAREIAETHFGDMCELEFTVENGRLFILSVRPGKRTPIANVRFALDFLSEGKIDSAEFCRRIRADHVEQICSPEIRNEDRLKVIGIGLPACGGVAVGGAAFSRESAARLKLAGRPIIYVRMEVSPEDLKTILSSEGVWTGRGGVSSHAALMCRELRKPCVTGSSGLRFAGTRCLLASGSQLREGDWISLNGSTGNVYAGRAQTEKVHWHQRAELVAVHDIIDHCVRERIVPIDVVGEIWAIQDFLLHNMSVRRPQTSKRPVLRTNFTSFDPPTPETMAAVRQSLRPIPTVQRHDYSRILLSLSDTLMRLLSATLGIGMHHAYFRPLWDPMAHIEYTEAGERSQVVGFEFADINRYIPHLVDVGTVTFFLQLELNVEADEWFLDFTNAKGESLIASSDRVAAYCLLLNDAPVESDELPLIYDSIRRREDDWQFYRGNSTSFAEIVGALGAWQRRKTTRSDTLPLCYELGLIRRGQLTLSGRSLLGLLKRSRQYHA